MAWWGGEEGSQAEGWLWRVRGTEAAGSQVLLRLLSWVPRVVALTWVVALEGNGGGCINDGDTVLIVRPFSGSMEGAASHQIVHRSP